MRQVPLPLALWALLVAPGGLGAQAPEHHPGRCDPPVRAGPARGGPGRRGRDHRRGPATERLGGLPSIGHGQLVRQRLLQRGPFAGRPGHRAGHQRQHHQPERQHVALRQHGPLHRLPARRRKPGRQGRADRGGGVADRCPFPAGAGHHQPVLQRARRRPAGQGTAGERAARRGAAQGVGQQAAGRLGHALGHVALAGHPGQRQPRSDPGRHRAGHRRSRAGAAGGRDRPGRRPPTTPPSTRSWPRSTPSPSVPRPRPQSPLVRSTVAQADAARAGLSAAKSAYWPSLTLGAQHLLECHPGQRLRSAEPASAHPGAAVEPVRPVRPRAEHRAAVAPTSTWPTPTAADASARSRPSSPRRSPSSTRPAPRSTSPRPAWPPPPRISGCSRSATGWAPRPSWTCSRRRKPSTRRRSTWWSPGSTYLRAKAQIEALIGRTL